MKNQNNKFGLLYKLFGVLGVVLIIAVYFMPIWWVALQSHQYPKSMYPKGIRIEFKYDGVYNGCEGVKERAEITTNEGADCLMEMTAINHYIGMFPIVQGANSHIYPAIKKLKEEKKLKENGIKSQLANGSITEEEHIAAVEKMEKDFEKDFEKLVPEYYVFDIKKDANDKDVIDPETGSPTKVNVTPQYLHILNGILVYSKYIFIFLVLLLIYFIITPRKTNAIFAFLPALLPFYFLSLYMYSMYWYGHHLDLHGGGAFAGIKPFMPTIFGHGKVAQFETVAYPYWGFAVDIMVFVVLILAILFKRKHVASLQQES